MADIQNQEPAGYLMENVMDDPKERLLLTAERLFAEFGLEAVSARQIALAAGQKNQSAIHYHFGTKEILLHTLWARRVREVNGRRHIILEEMVRNGQTHDVRALVGAIILPLAEKVWQTPNGGNYACLLVHLFADRRRRDLWIDEGEETALLRRIYRLLRRQLMDIPEALWAERIRFVVGGMINALAERERMRAANDPEWCALPDQAFIEHLIDAGHAILMAPVSSVTCMQLAQHDKSRIETKGKIPADSKQEAPRQRRQNLKKSRAVI